MTGAKHHHPTKVVGILVVVVVDDEVRIWCGGPANMYFANGIYMDIMLLLGYMHGYNVAGRSLWI